MKNTFLALSLLISGLFFSCNKDCEMSFYCALVPDAGPCEAAFTRYYYDAGTGECKEFIWGGCGGTVPFETLEECEACDCK